MAALGLPGTYHLVVVVAVGDVGLLKEGAEGRLQEERPTLPSGPLWPCLLSRRDEVPVSPGQVQRSGKTLVSFLPPGRQGLPNHTYLVSSS